LQQYVIVGTGFDSFAWRRPDLARQLRVYEVDHPDTQALKCERVEGAGLHIPEWLRFTPANFEKESVADALHRVDFQPEQRTHFAWHGVTYYLTREAVFDTFRALRQCASPGSVVVFDYWDAAFFAPESQNPHVREMFRNVAEVGEPFLTGFDPVSLSKELDSCGFRIMEDIGHETVQRRYFGDRTDGLAAQAIQRLAVAQAV
ncbi:MAG TPA: class I SAM-dependent methyltransferase, partial [Dehalococcoidia bacterium]